MRQKLLRRQLSVRCDEQQHQRLLDVIESIAEANRGLRPEISDIIRSVLGWGNRELLSQEEIEYLAGDRSKLDDFPDPGFSTMFDSRTRRVLRRRKANN